MYNEKEVNDKISFIFNKILNIDCIDIKKNEDSSDGNVYIINCEENKYIAKIYVDNKHTKSMIGLHKKLSKYNINVPNIIYTNYEDFTGKKDDIYIVIYSFIKGNQIQDILKDGKVDKKIIKYIAKEIRKMHDVTYGENEFNLPELLFDKYNTRKTMIHFDLTKSNIFLDPNGNIAIIDFDDAKYGSAVYDISILISAFFFSKKRGIDKEGMNAFIDEYYGENYELKEIETPLIKSCAIQWINYLLKENKLNDSLVETFNAKISLINNNL